LLAFYWRRLIRQFRRKLVVSFGRFMRLEHGSDWPLRLDQHHRATHLGVVSQPGCTRLQGGASKEEVEAEWEQKEFLRNVTVGLDIINKALESDWWNWTPGSTLVFWRWPSGFQHTCACDGMPPWIQDSLPRHNRAAKTPKPEDAVLLLPKFHQILSRGYVSILEDASEINSLINYFYVPKDQDICPVYNGASCGINQAIWAPNFWLPMAKLALQVLGFGYYSVDIDLGEFFLNFPFPELLDNFQASICLRSTIL
jgi:hypothetical protein